MDIQSEIKNCKIEFQCPKRWGQLRETDDAAVRFCDYCFEKVYLVQTEAQLAVQAAQGRCVAILDTYDEGNSLLGKIIA